jgi:hypothetical protein
MLGIVSLPFVYQVGVDFVDNLQGNLEPAYALTVLIYAVVYIPNLFKILVNGLQLVISGFREIVIPWMPANIPMNFRNYTEVAQGFKDHLISVYQPLDAFVSSLLGPNTMFISPARRSIFEEVSNKFKGRLRNLIIYSLLLAGVYFVFSDNEIAREILGGAVGSITSARTSLLTPLVLMVVLQLLLGGIEFVSCMFMVPREQPDTISHEGSRFYRGFGHPSQLFSRLPDLSHPLRHEEFENRVFSNWDEASTLSVGDVGEFSGYLVIEQQPKPVEEGMDFSAFLMLGVGWLLRVIGTYVVLFRVLPASLTQTGTAESVSAPLFALFMSLFATSAVRNGERLVGHGRDLLETCQFKSIAILIEAIGNLSRADVKIGKSFNDSIESSNVVARSDFTARFWASELTSEAARLDSQRELLALHRTDASHRWLSFFSSEIEKLRDEGVRPIGVDIATPEVGDIVRANLGVSGARAAAVQQAQLGAPAEMDHPMFSEGPQAPGIGPGGQQGQGGQLARGGSKYCPACGGAVGAGARFCRQCGKRFG